MPEMLNYCRTCNQDFGSVSAFDFHRVGKYEPLERRCLSVAEMTEKGWHQDRFGRWRRGTNPRWSSDSRLTASL